MERLSFVILITMFFSSEQVFPNLLGSGQLIPKIPNIPGSDQILQKIPDIPGSEQILPKIPNITEPGQLLPQIPTIPGSKQILANIPDLPGFKKEFYVQEDFNRMAELTKVGQDMLTVQCFLYGSRRTIERVLLKAPKEDIKTVNQTEMNKMIDWCTSFQSKNFLSQAVSFPELMLKIPLNVLHYLAIFPGTKYCGPGNISTSFEDLGPEEETDMCCREHDSCEISIPAGETSEEYGLENNALHTKSHCDCDGKFYNCLKDTKRTASTVIGWIYYDVVQIQCFKEDFPIVKCLKKTGIPYLRSRCKKYELDTSQPIKWQYFDAKCYTCGEEGLLNANITSTQSDEQLLTTGAHE